MKILCDREGNYIKIDDEYLGTFWEWRWNIVCNTRDNGNFDWNRFRTEFLPKVILQAADGSLVEHLDGDELNCQRTNLREITPEEQRSLNIGQFGRLDDQLSG